jgi:hypothetical protein
MERRPAPEVKDEHPPLGPHHATDLGESGVHIRRSSPATWCNSASSSRLVC